MAAWIGPSWTWSTVSLPDGLYQILVWVSDGPYTTPQAQSSTSVSVYTQSPCTAVSATVSPSQLAAGQPVKVTAVGTCPADTQPLYSYFTGPTAGGPWTLDAAWIGPNWTWDTTGLGNGTYYVTVWVSGAQYSVPEATALASITVNTPSSCTGVGAMVSPTTVYSGQSVTVTATSSCPSGTSPLFSYFTQSPSSPDTWTLQAAWTGPSWTWITTGITPGTGQVLVWVSDGPYTVPQAQVVQSVNIDAPASCSGLSVSAPSTVASGQPVNVDADATCPGGAQVEYSYFTMTPTSDSWTLQAAWIGPNWTWTTVGLAPGSYEVLVWASDGPYVTPQVQSEITVGITS